MVVPPPVRASRDNAPTARAPRISAFSGSRMAPRAYREEGSAECCASSGRAAWSWQTQDAFVSGIRTRPRTCATGRAARSGGTVHISPNPPRPRERRETLEAELALGRGADGRQRPFLEVPLGLEALLLDDAAVVQDEERALVDLAPAEGDAGVVLDDLQGEPGGGEERRVLSLADPERAAHAAGAVDEVVPALVDPGGSHRSAQLLERLRPALRQLCEREDRLGVDGHPRSSALEAVVGEDLLVVQDDPVVDADDRSVPDRMVVGLDHGMALGVVAHVDEHLARVLRDLDAVEELARAGALLVDVNVAAVAIRIADCVGAALGDAGQESLSGERPIDVALGTQAVSGDSAHGFEPRPLLGRFEFVPAACRRYSL